MIEFHIERFLEPIRKCFARRIVAINALVADRAHGDIGCSELGQVTTRAVLVTGKTRPRRVIIAMMTIGTTDRSMLRTRVQKL